MLMGLQDSLIKKEDVNQNNLLPFSSVEKSNIRLEDINFTSADKDGGFTLHEI